MAGRDRGRKAEKWPKKSLRELYVRFERREPGSQESKRISASKSSTPSAEPWRLSGSGRPATPAAAPFREHLLDRVDKRHFLAPMAMELDEWLKSKPGGSGLGRSARGLAQTIPVLHDLR